MSKKTRREKEVAELRRQLEVLKAQTKSYQTAAPLAAKEEVSGEPKPTAPKAVPAPTKIRRVDPKFIKKDLLKTLVLTILALTVVLALYLLRNQIPFF